MNASGTQGVVVSEDMTIALLKSAISSVFRKWPRWIGVRTLAFEVGITFLGELESTYARALRELVDRGDLLMSLDERTGPAYIRFYPSLLLPSPSEFARVVDGSESERESEGPWYPSGRVAGGGWMWNCVNSWN